MKKLLISTLITALPGMALADSNADEISKLKAQLKSLQTQMQALQKAVDAAEKKQVAAPAASATQQPAMSADDADELKQRVAGMEMKVDTLQTASTEGPLAGLSITGYMDPTYVYNRAGRSGSFQFANHSSAYNYYGSSFGDVYLDIKKTFGVGPMAPSAEITLLPNRGNGSTLLSNGTSSGNNSNIINTAQINYPLNDTTTVVAGLISSFGGYEVQQSNQMLTLTHGLLYDFSDPGNYVGVGFNYTKGNWAWKFFVGNEQYHTAGSTVQDGTNSSTNQTTTKSNNSPSFTVRTDYTWSSALDLGWSANLGRQTLSTASSCLSGSDSTCSSYPYGMYYFTETDATYIVNDIQYNAELDYGTLKNGAWNGGDAVWYGASLLAHTKWSTETFGRMGATIRYDYMNDSKNGGGGGGIVVGSSGYDGSNGWGIDPTCTSGSSCKGANRQALTADLMFYPTDQLTLKFEYRHDWASNAVFLKNNGNFSKSNDILGAQMVYTF